MLSSFAVGVSGQRSPQSNIAENKNPLKVGANLAHIEKYTKVYRERYPNATIFLLRSYHNFFWSSERTIVSGTRRSLVIRNTHFGLTSGQASKIMPLVACLDTLGCIKFTNGRPSTLIDPLLPVTLSPLSTPRILLHSFSNGTI